MRLFVAVRLPEAVVDGIAAAVPADLPEGLDPIDRRRWIVKLRPLGHVGAHLHTPLVEAVRDAVDGAPRQPVRLGPTVRRYAGRALCVPVDGLDELAAAVFEATEPLVPVTHPQPFHGEVMVAAGRVPRGADGTPVEGGWVVDDLRVLADRSSPRGVRLDDLAVIPLG